MRANKLDEHISEHIVAAMAIIVALLFAFYAGNAIAHGRFKIVFGVIAAIPLVFAVIQFRTRLWLLIPLTYGVGGVTTGLPVGLPLHSFAIVYVFVAFLLFKAFKIHSTRPTFDVVDMLLFVNLLYLILVFVRNPAWGLGFGTDRIGGRPYFQIAIAFLGYWVLSRVTVSPKLAHRLPALMIIAPCFDGLAGFLGDKFPRIAGPLARVYSGFATADMKFPNALPESGEPGVEASRLMYLTTPGSEISKALISYFDVLTLVNPFYLLRTLLFAVAVIFLLLSGFRSAFFSMVSTLVLASYLRSGFGHLLKIGVVGIPILLLLVLGQGILFDLPLTAQRTLSFLPGRWNHEALVVAEGSIEWRLEMWKEALKTDRYIHDRVFGDGFGVERKVWKAVQLAQDERIAQNIEAEGQAIMGGFHHGPLSTIRVVGYVGMVFYAALLCAVARKGWILVRRAKETPFLPLTLFVAIPTILSATFYFIGGGNFDPDFERTIFALGMLKMIEASLVAQESAEAVVPQPSAAAMLPRHLLSPLLGNTS